MMILGVRFRRSLSFVICAFRLRVADFSVDALVTPRGITLSLGMQNRPWKWGERWPHIVIAVRRSDHLDWPVCVGADGEPRCLG